MRPSPLRAAKVAKAARRAKATTGPTFEVVAKEWYDARSAHWSKTHSAREMRGIRYLADHLGTCSLDKVDARLVFSAVQRVTEDRSAAVGRRVLGTARAVFSYAVATGQWAAFFVDWAGLARALPAPKKVRHMPAVTEPAALGQLLGAISAYKGQLRTTVALRLLPMLLVRPGELRKARWSEIDLDSATWAIPADKMKMRHDHIVPLPSQAIALLQALRQETTGDGFVFGSERPLSPNALGRALNSLGYAGVQTPHGFRATARTIIDEVLGERPELIEHQLAHAVRDANGRAYNRTTHLAARRAMLQKWADYLDHLQRV